MENIKDNYGKFADGQIYTRTITTGNMPPAEALPNTIVLNHILPTKTEPIIVFRFICELPGTDAWAVRQVLAPELNIIDGKLVSNEEVLVEFYDVVAPSIKQQIIEVAKTLKVSNLESDMIIKQLDPVGNVISKTVYKNINITSILLHGTLNYDNPYPATIHAKIRFSECIVEF